MMDLSVPSGFKKWSVIGWGLRAMGGFLIVGLDDWNDARWLSDIGDLRG